MKKTTTYENDIRQKEKQQAEQIQKEKVNFSIFGRFLGQKWSFWIETAIFFLKIRPEIGIFYLSSFGWKLGRLKFSILKVWFWPWLGRMNLNPRKNQNRACQRKSQNQTSKFKNHRAKSLSSPQQPRTHHLIRLNKMIIF